MKKTKPGELCFEELDIDRLFVDEAHNFKNVPLKTKIEGAPGISITGSKRCQDMLDKVSLVQSRNQGGGVIMATGTPISNSVTDVFVLQKYLQSGELALLDLQHFDSWLGMFAEKKTAFEIDVDTGSYRLATRFSRFHNLPELTALLSSIADFHQMDEQDGIPKLEGYQDVLVEKTEALKSYLTEISERADLVRSKVVRASEDNMLKITTDGRKAALDLRLIDPGLPFDKGSKVAACAENIVEVYEKTKEKKGSFDAYSWQLLETKQRFITDLLSGSMRERSGTDIEDTVLGYGEVKALAALDKRLEENSKVRKNV